MKYFKLFEELTEMDHHSISNDIRSNKYSSLEAAVDQNSFDPSYNDFIIPVILLNTLPALQKKIPLYVDSDAEKLKQQYKQAKQLLDKVLNHKNMDKFQLVQTFWDLAQYKDMNVRDLAKSKLQVSETLYAALLINFAKIDSQISDYLDHFEKLEDFDVL
jgi:hypothetical protein